MQYAEIPVGNFIMANSCEFPVIPERNSRWPCPIPIRQLNCSIASASEVTTVWRYRNSIIIIIIIRHRHCSLCMIQC